nr:MAG TPA: hypothetical protein [Caudoviricetes sp.]
MSSLLVCLLYAHPCFLQVCLSLTIDYSSVNIVFASDAFTTA